MRADDVARARRTPERERLAQALDLMKAGIVLKRSALRVLHPEESDKEIESRLTLWLRGDDG